MPKLAKARAVPSQSVRLLLELLAFALFAFAGCALIYFVGASFTATDNGPILWGEGWKALKGVLHGMAGITG